MAHRDKNKVDWNKSIVYKDEAAFLEAMKESEFSQDELKDAYAANYVKNESKFEELPPADDTEKVSKPKK